MNMGLDICVSEFGEEDYLSKEDGTKSTVADIKRRENDDPFYPPQNEPHVRYFDEIILYNK